MKVKNGDIYVCKEPLQKLVDYEDMPIKYGIHIIRLARKFNEEYSTIEGEKNKLIKKHGEEKDGKVGISENSANFAKFIAEYTELMEAEIDFDVEKVKVPDFVVMSAKELAVLEPFIEVITSS